MSRHAVSAPTSAGADGLKARIAELIGEAAAASDRFGVAVSGGPDSLALLLLAHEAFPGRVAAASVDHRLRAEAAQECAHVATICAEMAVPHHILTPDVPPRATQADARALRYDLLEAWRSENAIDWLMTGHHADDQLETLVMRLNRSSGVAGLAGVRARNGRVLRPLLGWRRGDLAALVESAGITPVDDPSNRDPRYDRARLRLAMAGQDLLDPVAVSGSATNLADAETALAWAAQQLVNAHVRPCADGFDLEIGDWPTELLRRVVTLLLTGGPDRALRGAELHRFIAALQAGRPATLAGWTARPASDRPEIWQFRMEQGRRNS